MFIHLLSISAGLPHAARLFLSLITGFSVFILGYLGEAGNENTLHVTIQQNGSRVTLQKGNILEVTLPSSLGTGFGWQVRKGTDPVLCLRGKPETKSSEAGKLEVGATEYQVFRFEALSPGTARLEMEYLRPWEKDTPPAKTYRLTVIVK